MLEAGGSDQNEIDRRLRRQLSEGVRGMSRPRCMLEGHPGRARVLLGRGLELPDVGRGGLVGARQRRHFADRGPDHARATEDREIERRVEGQAPQRRAVQPDQESLDAAETVGSPLGTYEQHRA
jgi:hypothetical protein